MRMAEYCDTCLECELLPAFYQISSTDKNGYMCIQYVSHSQYLFDLKITDKNG